MKKNEHLLIPDKVVLKRQTCEVPKANRTILIISVLFAPNSVVGGKRFTFLSQLLAMKGFRVHTLTLSEDCIPDKDFSIEWGGFVHRVPMYPHYPIQSKGIIERVFQRLWEDYLCGLDPFVGWILPALLKGLRTIKKYNVDVLIATGPPFSSVIVALILEAITGVKLVVDYRDPWTSQAYIFSSRYKNRLFRILNRKAECAAISKASGFVFCSSLMREILEVSFPSIRSKTARVINNGFWPDQQKEEIPLYLEKNRKVMIYAGEFYGERRIASVAIAIRSLIDRGIISRDGFRFYVFGGNMTAKDKRVIEQEGLGRVIREFARVNYTTMVRYLKGADILFLPSGDTLNYAIPFKFYDYLQARRPILTIAPEDSELGRVMGSVDCGELVPIDNACAIEAALESILKGLNNYTFAGAEEFTWQVAAEKYAKLINSL